VLTPTPIFGLRRWEATDEFDETEVNANSDDIDAKALPRIGRQMETTVAQANTTTGVAQWFTAYTTTLYNLGNIAYAGGIYTVPIAGLYRWDGTVTWAATVGNSTGIGRRRLEVRVNGSPKDHGIFDDMLQTGQSMNSSFVQSANGVIALAAGDTVQMGVLQSSGITLNGILDGARFGLHLVA